MIRGSGVLASLVKEKPPRIYDLPGSNIRRLSRISESLSPIRWSAI